MRVATRPCIGAVHLRRSRRPRAVSARSLMMPEQREQNDDRPRQAEQPQQNPSAESHIALLGFLFAASTRVRSAGFALLQRSRTGGDMMMVRVLGLSALLISLGLWTSALAADGKP